VTFLRHPVVHFVAVLAAVGLLHLITFRQSEPYFNNDEIRHTMTGVFVADSFRDLPQVLADPKGYVVRYYCQYPALGIVLWPPLFYLVEGLAMLVLGPHFWVGRLCIAGFAVLALAYTYRFARLGLSHPFALLAVALTALMPVVFVLSQRVMLEIPTLAFVLAAATHFERYVANRRGRDAVLACLFAALATLTRFDGVVLAVYFGLRLIGTRNLALLVRRPVVWGVVLALCLTAPYYALTWKLYGSGIGTAAATGTTPDSTGFFHAVNFAYYPSVLPRQANWLLAVLTPLALVVALVRYRRESGPAVTLMLSVYLTFSPLAQLDDRHAIYWLPAVAVLGCQLVRFVFEKWGRVAAGVLAFALLTAATAECHRQAFRYLFGYDDAAKWVLAHRTTDRPILADGMYSGSVVYHVRINDPERKLWVLRGDKLLYAMFSDPGSGYKQYASTPAEVLDRLELVDPEFVVIEDPPPDFPPVPGVELLRTTLRDHPEKYQVVEVIPLRTNYDKFADPGTRLVVYRKLHRNPNAKNVVEIELIGLGRTVGAERK
jgi:Dolichyl-phosphate-mannose-protein mannosyltransferase